MTALALVTAMIVLTGCSGKDSAAQPGSSGSHPVGALPTGALTAPTAVGTLWSSGLDQNEQLGRPDGGSTTADRLAPVTTTAQSPVVAVGAGGRHSLAVLANGQVLSWGADDQGQLGHGAPGPDSEQPTPVIAPDGQAGVLSHVVAVSSDTDFSMALRSDGTVVTWGTGDAGQRGDGRIGAPDYPTTVKAPDGAGPLQHVVQISADGRTELALLNTGQVVAWGANTYGMLGDGTKTDRSLPVYVVGENGQGRLGDVRQVTVGGQNGVAILGDGSVVSWGHNDKGQLGDGSLTDRLVPGPVSGVDDLGRLSDVVQVSAAEKHVIALRGDGSVVAWGNNTAGQLGDGTLTLRTAPVVVSGEGGNSAQLTGVRSVDAGEAYGVAIMANGTVLDWGADGKGQLGDGDRTSRSTPGPVSSTTGKPLKHVLAVAAGERHLLVLTTRS